MSGSAPEQPQTSIPQSTPSVPDPAPVAVGPGGSRDVSFGEQNLSFTAPDVSLAEMMEVEYTQLQHMLYPPAEAQASQGEAQARLSAFSSSLPGNPAAPPRQPSPRTRQERGLATSTGIPGYPVSCQSGLLAESSSNPRLGYGDLQELRMMLLSESNLPLSHTDKMPHSSSVAVPGQSLAKVKYGENGGSNKGNVLVENSAPEPRSKPAVRVRLEDRFNSIQTEIPRCQEPQESGVTRNNLVTLIRQPSELIGVPLHQQENKCAALGKNKTSPATPSSQFPYPVLTMNAYSTAGGANPSQAQTSSASCAILEAAKHQDLGISKAYSFCYQEIDSTKQTAGAMNKALPEEVWVKVGESLCKQALNRRSCSQISPLDPNIDRKPLSEIQNTSDGSQSANAAQGPWQAAQSSSSLQMQSGIQDGIAQRRERHNRMERDRRRRIRLSCDELNLLVPFCTVDTDKATTLQWTTAFLKYIQERHGDSLKQEFETVFCSKTGRRLKIPRSDAFVTCPAQENTYGYEDQVA
ncbi:transcription factor-like 5 protein isoform X2 [Neopsephotus bourkii]|uniref:transcription factor-like 5 protein isoform X2 n=1 Tax=Neopsephotus bourkii TaxID=309878 RepID=UPI002AA52E92|nr:transcription factor-like 5 protein isoform X2 [Neopsephotus bourkii]